MSISAIPEIPISLIEPGVRFREDYGDLKQLAYSIRTKGLISPIAIAKSSNIAIDMQIDTNRPYILLAGGRRLKACRDILGWENIPVRIFDQKISLKDLRAIELAENFDRKDMEYAEQLALTNEIDKLQKAIHGEKIIRAADAPGWSSADTAKLMGKSAASISKDLKLANAIEKFPELGLDKCKNKAEAFKKLNNIATTIKASSKAKEYLTTTGSRAAEILSRAYVVASCFDVMAKIPTSSLDLIEIDPPYAINLNKVKRDNTCDGYNEIPAEEYAGFMIKLLKESFRCLKDSGWLICWFGPDPWFEHIAQWIELAGFKLNRIPGIWEKSSGQNMRPETRLSNMYEMFFYARKSSSKLNRPGSSNIFKYSGIHGNLKYHPTQRPILLMENVYKVFCGPGSVGFIPCLGSGVGLVAGHRAKISMTGTDIAPQYKDQYILWMKEQLEDF